MGQNVWHLSVRITAMSAVLFVFLCFAVGAATPVKWAVLVGIDQYQREDVTPLKYAVADVKALASILRSACKVSENNIFVLTSDQKGDNAPTRTNVAFRLDWLKERVKPNDTVFFVFSGHGIETGGESYLMTYEADPRSLSTLETSGLNARWLQKKLSNIPAQHMLVVVDACRNDPHAGRGDGDNKLGQRMARDLAVQRRGASNTGGTSRLSATLFACEPGQRSYEWPEVKHGFFSYHLIKGLNGKAADGHGRVTFQSLVAYLEQAVPAASDRVLGKRQVPWGETSGAGVSTWTLSMATPKSEAHVPESTPDADVEAARKAEETRKAHEARRAEEARQAEQAREALRNNPCGLWWQAETGVEMEIKADHTWANADGSVSSGQIYYTGTWAWIRNGTAIGMSAHRQRPNLPGPDAYDEFRMSEDGQALSGLGTTRGSYRRR